MYGAFSETDGYVDELGLFVDPSDAGNALEAWLPTAVDVEDYDNFNVSPVCNKHEWSNGDTKYEDGAVCEHSDMYDMPYEDPRPIEFFNNLTVR